MSSASVVTEEVESTSSRGLEIAVAVDAAAVIAALSALTRGGLDRLWRHMESAGVVLPEADVRGLALLSFEIWADSEGAVAASETGGGA